MSAILSRQLSVFSYQWIKLLLLFILTTYYLLLTTSSAFAQNPASGSANTSYEPYATGQYISPQSPHYASLAIYNFSHALNCLLIGQSLTAPCLEFKLIQDTQGAVKSIPVLSNVNTNHGLVGTSLSLVETALSTPALSSSVFLADFGEQIGIKSAHAQVGGSGSGVLARIYNLWEVSRNISYLAMIVIFIVVGFAVMFRQKLNPQTVISIQLALPGLVIGLVMITFSYFLASLISDMAFLGTNVVGYYFALAQGSDVLGRPPLINPEFREENVVGIFGRALNSFDRNTVTELVKVVWWQLPSEVSDWLRTIAVFLIGQIADGYTQILQGIPTYGVGLRIGADLLIGLIGGAAAPEGTVGLLLSWIAWFILLYSMFRLLFRLISSLLTIIFLTIAGPFYFLATALPGKQGLLPNWFFNMLCNVLVFPAVVAVLYFIAYLLGNTKEPAFIITNTAQLTTQSTFPLLGGIQLDLLTKLLAFGALIALPSIPDVICRVVGRPSQLGGVVGGAIAGGIAAGQRYSGQSQQGLQGLAGRASMLPNRSVYVQVKTADDAMRLGLAKRMEEKDWKPGNAYYDKYNNQYVNTTRSYFGGGVGAVQKTLLATGLYEPAANLYKKAKDRFKA